MKRQYAYQVTLPDGRSKTVSIARKLKAPCCYVVPHTKGWSIAAVAEQNDVRYRGYQACEAKAA